MYDPLTTSGVGLGKFFIIIWGRSDSNMVYNVMHRKSHSTTAHVPPLLLVVITSLFSRRRLLE